MKIQKNNVLVLLALFGLSIFSFTSCDKDEDPIVEDGIMRSELILTEVTGGEVHGDHFHGLGDAVETGDPIVIKFDGDGNATSGGHIHLEAEAIYKIELKAWNFNGREVQHDFIATEEIANNYKAFLIGGSLVLNQDTDHEDGAIFQPRELEYGDGTEVTGAGGTGTTGIISYFTIGHENEDLNDDVTYVLRKVNAGVKPTISRSDWNRRDYASAFAGENVLELTFEIHVEHGDGHDH